MGRDGGARHRWALEQLDPHPADRVLEVGCGHGVLVTLLAERLTAGHVVGLDRSATMTVAASSRNESHVAAGRATVVTGRFEDETVDGLAGPFDAIVAVHVADFWRKAPAFLGRARNLLVAKGPLLLVHQAPGWTRPDADAFTVEVGGVLEAHGFTVERTTVFEVDGSVLAAVRATPTAPPSSVVE